MNNGKNSRIDYGIILSVMLLAIIGLTTLYSTTSMIQGGSIRTTLMQVGWYAVGILLAGVIMLFDSKQLWKLTDILYIGGIVLLIVTLFIYDRDLAASQGAKSWIRIPLINFTFQSSEFVKIPYLLKLAKEVTKHNNKVIHKTNRSDFVLFFKLIGYSLPLFALIMLQNDLGTTLVYLAIMSGIILVSGIRWRILLPLIGTVLVLGLLVIYLAVYHRELLKDLFGVKEYQFQRIDTWLDPYHDISSSSYQVTQAFKAIGSGGVFGKGLGVSEVFVPVRGSDMIFATIGENFGFIGSSFLIFVYFVLIYNMIRVVYDTKNEFYAYIAVGVIMMIVFHVLENIGMNIGLLPVTGIPLPFVSQGGSALVGNMMGIGLIMSMRFHHHSYYFESDESRF